MRTGRIVFLLATLVPLAGCQQEPGPATDSPAMVPDGTFGSDVAFLSSRLEVLVLRDADSGAGVAVVPAYQGRVMTSSPRGDSGPSTGWINYDLIASGDTLAHINPYGGEDRFWLGPEGGQFSLYFSPGDPFDLEHWQVPAEIDTEPFEVLSRSDRAATFGRSMELTNYSGTVYRIGVRREVSLYSRQEATSVLGVEIPAGVDMAAYGTDNRITNEGEQAWDAETGMPSMWILGMYNPSAATTVVVPFVEGPESELGPIVNDAYFGKVPEDRLVTGDGVLFFKGDGQARGKIGLSPHRATSVLGSFDAVNGILTVVQYSKPEATTTYVNSMWELQDAPFSGDVVNSYNDGPPEPGASPMGPFYELETSSPAAGLAPGETLTHTHRTFHFMGPEADLDAIARAVLGVGLDQIRQVFGG